MIPSFRPPMKSLPHWIAWPGRPLMKSTAALMPFTMVSLIFPIVDVMPDRMFENTPLTVDAMVLKILPKKSRIAPSTD